MNEAQEHWRGKYIRLLQDDRWEFVSRLNTTGITAIVAVTDEQRLIFVEQYRRPVEHPVIEFPSGLAGDGSSSTSGLDDATNQLLNSRVIYFEYDSSALTLESEAVVQAHAQYLASAQGVGLILEGHADERGTREYNLALGEDRANSVANLMQALGVSASRIQTISYGEERPVSLGSDESAWSLNRRVEILYQ